tara:strand:- start:771 stop:1133 length:363 start_codon:yes stop_codon:yes gene_type:complete
MRGNYQNNIIELKNLELTRYENIFKIYNTGGKNFFYYNINKKISVPDNLDPRLFLNITLPQGLPLTTLSYNAYGTIDLWWLILLVNNITNPIKDLPIGKKIKLVKPQFIEQVLDTIESQL